MSEVYLISLGFFIFMACVGVAVLVLVLSLIPSKSQSYRKYLSNMYVASRIRQLATEDKIDIDLEGEKFKSYVRLGSKVNKDLDKTIEEDLKERIEETYNKEKPKK